MLTNEKGKPLSQFQCFVLDSLLSLHGMLTLIIDEGEVLCFPQGNSLRVTDCLLFATFSHYV